MPTTYVLADQLSTMGILDGLRQRRAYVTKGPQLSFDAKIEGKSYPIGADMGIQEGQISFIVALLNPSQTLHARLIENGATIAQTEIHHVSEWQYQHQADPDKAAWYRLELSDETGDTLAITNPIFAGPIKQPDRYYYGEF